MRILPDDAIAALNAWMEARGESFEGQVAVCEVMRNRLKDRRYGNTVTEVVLKPYAFSGWNTQDPNRAKALALDDTDPGYQRALKAWEMSATTNLTKGATLYLNPAVVTKVPSWAKPENRVAVIGRHEFYVEG